MGLNLNINEILAFSLAGAAVGSAIDGVGAQKGAMVGAAVSIAGPLAKQLLGGLLPVAAPCVKGTPGCP